MASMKSLAVAALVAAAPCALAARDVYGTTGGRRLAQASMTPPMPAPPTAMPAPQMPPPVPAIPVVPPPSPPAVPAPVPDSIAVSVMDDADDEYEYYGMGPAPAPAPAPSPLEFELESGAAEEEEEEPAMDPAIAAFGTGASMAMPNEAGLWPVCVDGDSQTFGKMKGNKPCGIEVTSDGNVTLGEFFGGFDAYWSLNPADGHEDCFSEAVAEMLGEVMCEADTVQEYDDYGELQDKISCLPPTEVASCVCVGYAVNAQKGWTMNAGMKKFLTDMRKLAGPVNYDYPEDIPIVDEYGRAQNLAKSEAAMASMISVMDCSSHDEDEDHDDEDDAEVDDEE